MSDYGADVRLHLTAVDECIFAVALRVSAPAFVHCAPTNLRSREAAREGGYIEPFTFTLRLVCGTAKAVWYRSVAHAFSICAGHSRSDVQLGAQFTYLVWDKLGNGWLVSMASTVYGANMRNDSLMLTSI